MSSADLAGEGTHRSPANVVAALTAGAGLALLGYCFICFLAVALRAIRYPYELDYGEGIVWQQMRLMFTGKAYAPVNGYPGIVFHYPPIYHSTVEALATISGMDEVAAGRLISLIATLLCSLIIGGLTSWIVARRSKAPIAAVCGAFSSLTCFTLLPVTYWAMVMRVDMLALFFSLAGLSFGVGSLTKPVRVYTAALCFIAAVFTKQIAIAAPASVFAVLLIVRPATAWRGILACLVGGSVVLAALAFATNGGILRHLFVYNVNRFNPTGLELIPAVMLNNILFFAALAAGVLWLIRKQAVFYAGLPSWLDRRAKLIASQDDPATLMILVYFVATTLVALLVAKSGANINYLVEWLLAGSIFAGLSVHDAVARAMGEAQPQASAFSILLPAALGVQALVAAAHVGWQLDVREQRRQELDQLVALVHSAPHPIISDDMVLLQRGGKNVVIEAAIFAELTSTGRWDERPFIRHILSDDFSFFITEGDRGGREFDSRYTPAVVSALDKAYPNKCLLGGYVIHYPTHSEGSYPPVRVGATHSQLGRCNANKLAGSETPSRA